MSQMVRESKPEVPWHQLSVEIDTGEVVFLTELIVVYLENSSCWSKVTASLISHPLSPGVLFGLIALDITRESTSSLGSSLCIWYSFTETTLSIYAHNYYLSFLFQWQQWQNKFVELLWSNKFVESTLNFWYHSKS